MENSNDKDIPMRNSRLWLSCTLLAAAWLLFSGQKAQAWFGEKERTTLEVRSVPDAAQVQFNDRPIGMTDGVFKIEPGRVQIRVRKNGYEDSLATLEVKDGQHLLRSFELRPLSAQLSVKSLKPQDVLWIGPGKPRKISSGNDAIKLDPGLYEVWAVRDGLESERVLSTLEAGEKKTISLAWVSARPATTPSFSGPGSDQDSNPGSGPANSTDPVVTTPRPQVPQGDYRPITQPPRVANFPRGGFVSPPTRPEPVVTPISDPGFVPPARPLPPPVSEPAPVFTPLP